MLNEAGVAPLRRLASHLSSPLGVAVLLAALALADRTGSFRGHRNANELSRFQAAAAMALRGRPDIGPEMERLGEHVDWSAHAGRRYSNKAPGLSFLMVPVVWIGDLLFGPPTPANLTWYLYAAHLFTVTLAWLLAARPLARLALRLGASESGAIVLFLALTFASPLGLYAAKGYSHVLAAALLVLVAERLFDLPADLPPGRARWAVAGSAAALAATSEYPVAVPAAVLFAVAWLRRPKLAGVLFASLGGLVALLPFLVYNTVCFGGPLALSSGFEGEEQWRAVAAHGVFGVGAPSPAVLTGLLVSPKRGLLLLAPWFGLAVAGLLRRSDDGSRPLRLALGVASLSLYLVIAGYPNWHGGWATGPRYLVPILPLLALGLARTVSGEGEGIPKGLLPAALLAVGFSLPLQLLAATTTFELPLEMRPPQVVQAIAAVGGAWSRTVTSGEGAPLLQLIAATAAFVLLAGWGRPGWRRRAVWLGLGALLGLLSIPLAGRLPGADGIG